MLDVVSSVAAQVFIPFSVGGGLRSVADCSRVLLAGAEKVNVNSAAVAFGMIGHRYADAAKCAKELCFCLCARRCTTSAKPAQRSDDSQPPARAPCPACAPALRVGKHHTLDSANA